jgi:hypothetical protein
MKIEQLKDNKLGRNYLVKQLQKDGPNIKIAKILLNLKHKKIKNTSSKLIKQNKKKEYF